MDSQFLGSAVEMLILEVIGQGPSYGYEITQTVAERSNGYFELKEGADLSSTFTRVAQELHSQYVIGFTPESLDGKLHALQVRVKRPGMASRARKNYIASPDR